jgi:MarR family transcriptional regulator, organic hydroperoxide resistance regulator
VSIDRRLFFLIHRAHRAMFVHGDAIALDELGVTTSQLGALYFIAGHEGCSLSDVANVLDMNNSAVTAIARRLETSGVLRRAPNPEDGRGTRLFTTDKGKTVRAQSLAVIRRLTAELTAGFSAAEIDLVLRFLNSIVDRLGDHEPGGPPR